MILHLLGAFALSCCLGASVSSLDYTENQNNDIQFQANKKQVSYNDEEFKITLTADELNNYIWTNVSSLFSSLGSSNNLSDLYLTYGNDNFTYGEYNVDYFEYDNGNITIDFIFRVFDNSPAYTFRIFNNDVLSSFENDIVFDFVDLDSHYTSFKTAIDLDIQANQVEDDLPSVMTDFVGILTSSIGTLATGIAGGVVSMASALFLTLDAGGNVTGLTIFGGIVAIFAGLALAVGITTKVYQWVTSLGN